MAANSDIDDALVGKLMNDATLMALTPDGVFLDVAKVGALRFVLVTLETDDSTGLFDGTSIEEHVYAVKAVMLMEIVNAAVVKSAETRIDELLHEGSLSVSGFSLIEMARAHPDGRIKFAERDEVDKSIRWQHRGGRYRVLMQKLAA